MATSAELEVLKEQLRTMVGSPKKGVVISEALDIWKTLQQREDWLRLINTKTGLLNQREIAAELCSTDNMWKKARCRYVLKVLNRYVRMKGYVKEVCGPSGLASDKPLNGTDMSKVLASSGELNPLKELAEMRLKIKLQQTEGKLHQANIRISKLEKELKKYTDLSEVNRAIELLMKPRR
ncbi:hypothetical protein G3488_22165 [Shewanella baltica]|jgi:hypothetical protein|uniref:hypothetical protein n=1 Tax=Shewanella baltica TaxID=62322 RepID=UPI00217DFE40|nr:hypothetical protein [Shewanella baltica]MCS6210772.1 hypothetical protein [Shewanella baltica]MCS6233521.1 hypothetical protein [Shewanella baltica]